MPVWHAYCPSVQTAAPDTLARHHAVLNWLAALHESHEISGYFVTPSVWVLRCCNCVGAAAFFKSGFVTGTQKGALMLACTNVWAGIGS
jgi:hypothetical protein